MPVQGKGMYETPQAAPDGLSTKIVGGEDPSAEQVKKSANARDGKRHDMKGDKNPDENVLGAVSGPVIDRAGIKNNGYLTKKGLPYGVNAFYNTLPPGMDIEDQENADIREMKETNYSGGLGYPGDGW